MFREELTVGSSCWCVMVVSCHSCHEADCPSEDSLFSFCFPRLLWPHPQTLGRPAERCASPAADFINKISSPTREASKPTFRPRQRGNPSGRLLSLALVAVSQSAQATVSVKKQPEKPVIERYILWYLLSFSNNKLNCPFSVTYNFSIFRYL